MPRTFHNPYNFVRTPSRTEEVLKDPFAGDHDPSRPECRENHSRYWSERYTGIIPVRLRTQTPLFITNPETRRKMEGDQAKEEQKAHYIYDCLEYIPATALKGMLSSAYEIVTNSRYRVFGKQQHEKRLGYRPPAEATLVPGRVSCSNGNWSVTLFTGTSKIKPDGSVDGPLYAAWLPCYRRGTEDSCPRLQHGSEYENVRLRQYQYDRRNITFWSVVEIDGLALEPITKKATATAEEKVVRGYVVKSGKIFEKKHDERFFFNCYPGAASPCPNPLPISDKVRKNYEDLIVDYQKVHEGDANLPIGGGSIHGAHITDKKRLKLSDGCFVYVRTDGRTVSALYPVQISRELNEKVPWDLLDNSLKPAESIDKLSPADRLFGWVAHGTTRGPGAWKGKVRIGDGVYSPRSGEERPSPVQRFDNPLPLSILGAPKPAQARFYLGDASGEPQADGLSKEKAGYKNGKKLRGRKVYLHHTLAHLTDGKEKTRYWDEHQGAEMSILPEYRQPSGEKQCTGQNRSITGWIPKGTDFRFDIKVENLTREELGALLALLSLEQQYFRLGFAKPLGLGSVALSIQWNGEEPLPFMTGADFAERYHQLDSSAFSPRGLSKGQVQATIQNYQKNVVRLYGTPPADSVILGDAELFPWEKSEFFKDLGPEQQRSFRSAWLEALEKDSAEPPMEALPDKEMLEELYPEEIAALPNGYRDILERVRVNCERCWRTIPFIKDFTSAMKGFNNAPVTYPRSEENRSDGFEGFGWFVENEKMEGGQCVNGHSLPAVGTPLSGL